MPLVCLRKSPYVITSGKNKVFLVTTLPIVVINENLQKGQNLGVTNQSKHSFLTLSLHFFIKTSKPLC